MEKLKGAVKRAIGNLIYYIQGDQPEKYEGEVERLLVLLGKAVLSGEYRDLDKALGVVGRSNPLKAHQALAVLRFESLDIEPEDNVILIAFHEGETELEEEKDGQS